MVKINFKTIRKDFPSLSSVVYFDSASVCPCPKPTIQEMVKFYQRYPYNYGVGVFKDSVETKERVDAARSALAKFIGAGSAKEIVFTKNTTEAINLVAFGQSWKKGDEVITTNIEHQSNLLPWFRLSETQGISVKIAECDSKGMINPSSIEELITERTKLITTTHVSNLFGTIQDVKEFGKIAKKHGLLFFVDAAQSGGRVPINVQDIGCQFLCLCGRKGLLAPQGTGALYVNESSHSLLSPINIGSRAANVTGIDQYSLGDVPYRYEAGVINTSGFIGLGRSVKYLNDCGIDRLQERTRKLTKMMIDEISSFDGIETYRISDIANQAGIMSWNMKGQDSNEVAVELFKQRKIAVASGAQGSLLALLPLNVKGVVRTSVQFFNTEEDIEILAKTLRKMTK
jgi:cysteine desulfurase/selenocysteine lyase